jgi:hypothetical protein
LFVVLYGTEIFKKRYHFLVVMSTKSLPRQTGTAICGLVLGTVTLTYLTSLAPEVVPQAIDFGKQMINGIQQHSPPEFATAKGTIYSSYFTLAGVSIATLYMSAKELFRHR